MTFLERLACYQEEINAALKQTLPSPSSDSLSEAMHYCVFNGGKRLRPLLVYFVGETLQLSVEQLNPIASSIELIHCYSLVHDDLPAMDNADLRRGQVTCHKKYNEAVAILAGDALLTLAFENLANTSYLPNEIKAHLIAELAKHSGAEGMIKGQMLDLNATNKVLSTEALFDLNFHKTGHLLLACIELPLMLNNELQKKEKDIFIKFAERLGLSYQIQDDLLDIEGQNQALGKKVGADEENHKNTFPSIVGLKVAKQTLQTLKEETRSLLKSLPFDTTLLQTFTDYIFERRK